MLDDRMATTQNKELSFTSLMHSGPSKESLPIAGVTGYQACQKMLISFKSLFISLASPGTETENLVPYQICFFVWFENFVEIGQGRIIQPAIS